MDEAERIFNMQVSPGYKTTSIFPPASDNLKQQTVDRALINISIKENTVSQITQTLSAEQRKVLISSSQDELTAVNSKIEVIQKGVEDALYAHPNNPLTNPLCGSVDRMNSQQNTAVSYLSPSQPLTFNDSLMRVVSTKLTSGLG